MFTYTRIVEQRSTINAKNIHDVSGNANLVCFLARRLIYEQGHRSYHVHPLGRIYSTCCHHRQVYFKSELCRFSFLKPRLLPREV